MPPTPAATSAGVLLSDVRDDEVKPYIVAAEIGKGSFATVFRGYHQDTHAQVAIKTVSRNILTPKLLENLQSEIKILKQLNHRHITELIEIVERPNSRNIYLIMEYCSGGDLSVYIKRRGRVDGLQYIPARGEAPIFYVHPRTGGLAETVCRSFLRQLARALKFLRQRNLIHRDIKPQNLLLTPGNERDHEKGQPIGVPILKIADFGFARILPNAMMAETLCGSPLYMAPEILRYEKYDAKADLWSVGAVLYEMTVGKPPFRAQNHMELLKRIEHARSTVKFPDEDPSAPQVDAVTGAKIHPVPSDIKQLIRSLLKRHPVERASFDDFFASPALAKSKMRRPSRSRSNRHEVASTDTPTTAAPPMAALLTSPAAPPELTRGFSETTAAKSPKPAPYGRPQSDQHWQERGDERQRPPAWVDGIPVGHRVIPKEVLDPNTLFPASPFDFRGRGLKEQPGSSPARAAADLLPGTGAGTNDTGASPSGAKSSLPLAPTTTSPPRSGLPELHLTATPATVRQASRPAEVDRDAPLATEMSFGGTHDYVLVGETRVVEFNKAIDEINAGRVRRPVDERAPRANSHSNAANTSGRPDMDIDPRKFGSHRGDTQYPPQTAGSRQPNHDARGAAPLPTSSPPLPQVAPSRADAYGTGWGRNGPEPSPIHAYHTPTRIASNALAKALNIASKKLFGNGAAAGPSNGSPVSAGTAGASTSPSGSATGSGESVDGDYPPPHYPPQYQPGPLTPTSAPASPGVGKPRELDPVGDDTRDEADDAMFSTLEDLAQKTNVLTKWADELFGRLQDAAKHSQGYSNGAAIINDRVDGKRRTSDMGASSSAATAVAVYMLLMNFCQRALDRLRAHQDSLPSGERTGPGFDAAVKWFKTTFIKAHERVARIKTWLPSEHSPSTVWIDHLVYERALQLSRSAARKELLDQANSPDECERLYEESLWCLYALQEDVMQTGNPFMEEDRNVIATWITRTKLRLVRCRNRMHMEDGERLRDARADLNLDDVTRTPAPWDMPPPLSPLPESISAH